MHHAALQQLAHIAKGVTSNGNDTYFETFSNVSLEQPPPSVNSPKSGAGLSRHSNTSSNPITPRPSTLEGDSFSNGGGGGNGSQGCLFIIGREALMRKVSSTVLVPSGAPLDGTDGSESTLHSSNVVSSLSATSTSPLLRTPPGLPPLAAGAAAAVAASKKPLSLTLPTTLKGEEPAAFATSTNSSFANDPSTPTPATRLVAQSSVFPVSEGEQGSPVFVPSRQGSGKVKGNVRTTPGSGNVVKGQVVSLVNTTPIAATTVGMTPNEEEMMPIEPHRHTSTTTTTTTTATGSGNHNGGRVGGKPDLHASIVWSPQGFLAQSFPSLCKVAGGAGGAGGAGSSDNVGEAVEPTELVCLLSEHIVKIEADLHHTTERRRIYMLSIRYRMQGHTDPLQQSFDYRDTRAGGGMGSNSSIHVDDSTDRDKVFRFVFYAGGTMRFLRALSAFRPHLVTEELICSLSEGAGSGGAAVPVAATTASSPQAAAAEQSGESGRHRGWGRAFRLFSGAKQLGARYYPSRGSSAVEGASSGPVVQNTSISSMSSASASSPRHSQHHPANANDMDELASSASEDLTVVSARQPGAKLNVLTADMWASSFLPGPAGILDAEKWRVLREQCFLDCSTIDPAVRLEVWGYCLGLYPVGSTRLEREEYLQEQKDHYATLTQQWESIYPEQEAHFSAYRTNKDKIAKDVVRTERTNPFFAEETGDGLLAVRHVLMAHLLYNLDLAYCQGMSDVAAVLVLLTDADEATTFVYFKLLLERHMKHSFTMSSVSKSQFNTYVQQWVPKTPVYANGVMVESLPVTLGASNSRHAPSGLLFSLKELQVLVRHFLPDLYACLQRAQCEDMSFCFQCLITSFKRELDVCTSVLLWDSMLCCPYHEDFALYVLLGLLRAYSSTAELRHHYFYSSDRVIKFMSSVRLPVEELVWAGVDMLVEAATEAARLDGLLRGHLEAHVHLDTSLEEVVGLCIKFDGEI